MGKFNRYEFGGEVVEVRYFGTNALKHGRKITKALSKTLSALRQATQSF